MTLVALVNGRNANADEAIATDDRAFNYGDGLFETLRVREGTVRFVAAHLERLLAGCTQLGISPPERAQLLEDIAAVSRGVREGVVKIVVSRGAGGRGYRPPPELSVNRVVTLHPAPAMPVAPGIRVRWCETRLARNARLAGLKHLNRLEQVLAQAEWQDPEIAEGLMLDTEGELVGATAGNIFLVRDGMLATPDMRFCGVRGVMRGEVLKAAEQLGVAIETEPLWPHDIDAASELFITNVVRGIRPVIALDTLVWAVGPLTRELMKVLPP